MTKLTKANAARLGGLARWAGVGKKKRTNIMRKVAMAGIAKRSKI